MIQLFDGGLSASHATHWENAAIKRLVYIHLLSTLNIYTSNGVILSIEDRKIPLYKGRDDKRILYISGVALQLAKSHNSQAMEIAEAIANQLSETCNDILKVQIVPPGWIHLTLTHPTLAAWLQNLVRGEEHSLISIEQIPIIHQPKLLNYNPLQLFAIQSAHARCCSILSQAHREGLIQFSKTEASSSVMGNLISPHPIPWLNIEQKLLLHHPAEIRLISELVQVVDHWESSDFSISPSWEKTALSLSQAIEHFWCQCRIWGEVKISDFQLSQARLGLLLATQLVFRALLVQKLGSLALTEL